jgi:methylated-DNA-protein-cysteine methyltransferase-like protein
MHNAAPPDKQDYYEQVWALVRQIPYGKVATYGQLSKMLPQPDGVSTEDYLAYASRWVGFAMSACPDDVPWHRVINSQGRISHPEAARQIKLLQRESVYFSNDRLNLDEFQWRASKANDEPAQGRLF